MLTRKQLDSITINAIAVKMLITFPHNIIEICKNAAWISVLYCIGVAVLILSIIYKLYHSDKNVIALSEKHGGAVLRIITGLFVFAVLFANFFTMIRIFPEIVRLVLLQTTYVQMIGLLFAVCIVLGAYCGIDAIARVQEMFIHVAGIVFICFIGLLVPNLRMENIFPLLGSGAFDLFVYNLPFLSVFSDLLVLNIIIPHMQDFSDYRRAGIKSVLTGGAFAAIVVAAYCLSYPHPVTETFLVPIYQLERLVHLSGFFSRLEAIFQFFWSISILLYSSLYLFVMAETWKTSFNLRETKPLILPIAVILSAAALIPDNLPDTLQLETIINRWIYIPVFAIPLILGAVDAIKLFHVKQKSNTGGDHHKNQAF